MIFNEMFEEKFPQIVDGILDFQGQNKNDFIDLVNKRCTGFVGQYVAEVEDGFIEGVPDIMVFIRENIKAMMRAACDPAKAAMAEMMGVPPIMAYINRALERYQTEQQQQPAPQ